MSNHYAANDFEHILDVSLSNTHELSSRIPGKPGPNEEVFRTKAAILLKQTFGKDLFTLSETNLPTTLSLRVAIRTPRVEEFRAKVKELGFAIKGGDESES